MTKPARLAFLAAVALGAAAHAQTQRLAPADVRGIRNLGGGPVLLTFLAIKAGTEDRTVMEFDLRALPGPAAAATLELGMSNIDPGPPDGVVDIFKYAGDGVVVPAEFYAGVLETSFVYNNGPGLARVDLTALVNDFRLNGRDFLGLRLSTATTDRFWLGSIIGQPAPVLVVDGGTACYPDCDTSTGRRVLDIFDFLCFQNRYDANSPYACDCDTSTGPGVCDIFDFLCFQNAYDAGCP